jgi:rod shape-determining protein MreB
MTRNITQYVRDAYSLLIGEKVAEEVKWRLGSTLDTGTPYEMEVRGRHLVTGLPKQIILKESEVRDALQRNIAVILSSIKATLEATPAELVADIYERGVVLVGGSALLRGIEKTIARETAIPVRVIEDPMTANVRGAAALLANEELLKGIALPSTQDASFA